MDEEDNSKIIEFGISEEARVSFKSKTLGTVVPYRYNEFLVIGQKNLIRFDTETVKETYPYILTTIYHDVEHKLFIGVTAHTPEFIIIFEFNLNTYIKTGVKIDDYCVFNIIFSKKTSTIITVGSHMKTWKFSYIPSTCRVVFELPTIIIEPLDTVKYNCNWGILNPPMFDFDDEELLINDYKGNIISYNLKGRKNGIAVNYGCTDVESCFAYNSETKQLISNNILQGAVIWNRNGSNSDQTFLGSSLTKFIQFINYEFVILLDARNVITIFDIITHDFFSVYQIDREVSRIFYYPEPYPRLFICAKTDVIVLRITLPWRYWYTTGSRSIMMERVNKLDEAARVLVELSNAQIRLLSPINSRILTGITLKTLSSPISFYYDRGLSALPKIHRDQILIPLVNGQMQIFSTNENPCEEIDCYELKILCICQCIYKGKYAFCFGTSGGNLMFYDYKSMKQLGRIVAYPAPILNVFYHEESDALLIAIEDRVLRMDLGTGHVVDFIRLKYSKLNLYFDGILFVAQDSGKIRSVCIIPEDPYQVKDTKYNNNKISNQKVSTNENNNNQYAMNSNMTSRTNLNMVSRSNLNVVSKNNVNIASKSTLSEKEEEEKTAEKDNDDDKDNDKELFIKKKLDIPFKFTLHDSNGMSMHEGQITGLSLGSVFFVSCSIDKTLRVWNRDFTQRCLIVFPLPLYSCCALNGKRDILVSTEKEIMIIKGSIIFDDQVDEEDTSIDNYDRKRDKLYHETTTFVEEEEEEEIKEDPLAIQPQSKSKRRRNRFAEALRRQEEENQRKIQEWLAHRDDPEYRKKLERILEEAKKNLKQPEEEKKEEPKQKQEDSSEYEYEEYEEEFKEPALILPEEIKEEPVKETPKIEEIPEENKEEEEKQKKAVLSQFFGGAPKKTNKPKSSQRPAKEIDVTKYINNNANSSNKANEESGKNDDDDDIDRPKKKKGGKKKDFDSEERKSTKKKSSKKKQQQQQQQQQYQQQQYQPPQPQQQHQHQQQSHSVSPKRENQTKLSTKATNTDYGSTPNSEYTGPQYSLPPTNTTSNISPTLKPTQPTQPGFGPSFSKVTKQRRYPTPLKESKKPTTANRRPSSSNDQKISRTRSKTPEPRMPIVDRIPNPPPLNIIFDIEMIARMVDSGDTRYQPILDYLARHGLVREGNTWDIKMSVPSSRSSPKSPRRKSRIKSQRNPTITNYQPEETNSKFIRQFWPPPIPQPDSDDETGMKLFKNRVDELLGTKRLITPKNKNLNNNDRSGKIPSFQPKIVPTNQTQLDVALFSDTIKSNVQKETKSSSKPENEQILMRRNALKKQQEIRKQYLQQEQQEKEEIVVHYRSSPPIIPPVQIGEINKNDKNFDSSTLGVQNLIPEQKNIKQPNSARSDARVRLQNRNINSEKDRISPRKQRINDYDSNPSTPRSNEGPHFVEPIMPVYLRASGEIFICDKKISPFACKRYRLVMDENGPKKSWRPISPQNSNNQNNKPLSSALVTTQQQTSLIDQVNKSPRTVKKPLSQKSMRRV